MFSYLQFDFSSYASGASRSNGCYESTESAAYITVQEWDCSSNPTSIRSVNWLVHILFCMGQNGIFHALSDKESYRVTKNRYCLSPSVGEVTFKV